MPGFFDIKSADWTVWAIFASVIMVFTGFTMVMMDDFGSSTTKASNPVIKCTVTDYSAEITREQKMEMAQEAWDNFEAENPEGAEAMLKSMSMMGPGMMMPGMGRPGEDGEQQSPEEMAKNMILRQWGDASKGLVFKNPETGDYTVFNAMKCIKCDNIFHRDYEGLRDFPDECTSCGYSRAEENIAKRKSDKNKERERKRERREKRKNKNKK